MEKAHRQYNQSGITQKGVTEEGALADLLLVNDNPLESLDLVADPDKNFVVIMKDGKIYKDTVK